MVESVKDRVTSVNGETGEVEVSEGVSDHDDLDNVTSNQHHSRPSSTSPEGGLERVEIDINLSGNEDEDIQVDSYIHRWGFSADDDADDGFDVVIYRDNGEELDSPNGVFPGESDTSNYDRPYAVSYMSVNADMDGTTGEVWYEYYVGDHQHNV